MCAATPPHAATAAYTANPGRVRTCQRPSCMPQFPGPPAPCSRICAAASSCQDRRCAECGPCPRGACPGKRTAPSATLRFGSRWRACGDPRTGRASAIRFRGPAAVERIGTAQTLCTSSRARPSSTIRYTRKKPHAEVRGANVTFLPVPITMNTSPAWSWNGTVVMLPDHGETRTRRERGRTGRSTDKPVRRNCV